MKITSKILAFALAAVLMIGGVSVPASAADDTYIVPLGKYSEIHPFSDGVAVVEDFNGSVGVIDTTGREIIPLGKYGYMYNFSDGVAWAAIWDDAEWNGGWRFRLIDKTGKELTPVGKYNHFNSFSGGMTIAQDTGSGDFVIIDTSGREVVNLGDKYSGFQGLRTDGMVISTAFSDGLALAFNNGAAISVIDTSGKEIMRYDKDGDKSLDLSGFHDGVAVEYLKGDYSSSHNTVAGVAVIDKTGKVIVPYGKYASIGTFSDGMSIVEGFNGSYGVIDTTGKEVVPIGKYDAVTFEGLTLRGLIDNFSDGVAVVESRDENWVLRVGVIDKTGKEIIPLSTKYASIDSFRNGMAVAYETNDAGTSRGIIDKTGKEILPPTDKYADIKSIYDGVAIVNVGGYWDAWVGSEVIGGQWGIIKLGAPSAPADNPSSWAQADVTTAVNAGLVPSSLQSKYTQATTRAEFCALAVALYENVTGNTITERMTFNDTSDVNVQKMGALGVVTGVGNNNFAPDQKLTREQAATMLSRLADAIGKPLASSAATFADNGSISSWAIEGVGQVQAAGIMGGVGNNTFSPKTDYTREQSIVTILRLFDVVK